MNIHLISLGCPKNLVDSERLLGALGTGGAVIVSELQDSDVVILNTCAFIKQALEETEHEISGLAEFTRISGKPVYVYGCAVNRSGSRLRQRFPDIAGWFKLKEFSKLVRTITQTCPSCPPRLPLTTGYAYLKIADGCSNCCSYCTIPSIKGPYKSVPFEELLDEAQKLANLGKKELILIAQDTADYGVDLYGKKMLVPLLQTLSRHTDVKWLRIMYIHPKNLDDAIMKEIAENPKVCRYLDMPLQHINDRILKAMNRHVTRDRILELVNELRKIKRISLRTTVIVGFPGETGDEFKELCRFCEEGYFDWLGVFPYSNEHGTDASKLDQLPQSVISTRYEQMMALQHSLIIQKNKTRVGKCFQTLVHEHNGAYVGHAEFAAPDIDGSILVDDERPEVGDFCRVRITGIKDHNLRGSVIEGTP